MKGMCSSRDEEFEEAFGAIMAAREYEEARGWNVEGEEEDEADVDGSG